MTRQKQLKQGLQTQVKEEELDLDYRQWPRLKEQMKLQEQKQRQQTLKKELQKQAQQTKDLISWIVLGVVLERVSRPSARCRTHRLDRLEPKLLVLPHWAPQENLDSNWAEAI